MSVSEQRFRFRVWDGEEMHREPVVYNSEVFLTHRELEDYIPVGEDCVVMQCSGCSDKWGNSIFEGDIVSCYDEGAKYYVEFCIDGFCLFPVEKPHGKLKDIEQRFPHIGEAFGGFSGSIEIVGNIYE